jgi:hypothetical protein
MASQQQQQQQYEEASAEKVKKTHCTTNHCHTSTRALPMTEVSVLEQYTSVQEYECLTQAGRKADQCLHCKLLFDGRIMYCQNFERRKYCQNHNLSGSATISWTMRDGKATPVTGFPQ